MDDEEQEGLSIRLWLGGIALFCVSFVNSCTELRYLVWGRTVDARVVRSHESDDGRSRNEEMMLAVHYSFQDTDGHSRKEIDYLSSNFPAPEGDVVRVQFIPGKDNVSRIEGNRSLVWVWILAAMTAAGIGMMFYFHRQVHKPVRSFAHERRAKRRKRAERRQRDWMT